MFQSQIYPCEKIFTDANAPRDSDTIVDGKLMRRGLVPRDYNKVPHGSMPFAAPINFDVIPEREWPARIEEMEKTKSRLSDIATLVDLPCKDQGRTNYCWANAPVYCVEQLRAVQNEPMIMLSPGSVAGPIKNYRNYGGWGSEALEFIVERGVCPVSIYPANQVSRGYYTEEAQRIAMGFRVQEWYDLTPRSFNELMTCLFLRIPVAVGYNWWRHEVTAVDPVMVDGQFGIRIRNSWSMNWGDRGYSILMRSKATPDDAVAPRMTSTTMTER